MAKIHRSDRQPPAPAAETAPELLQPEQPPVQAQAEEKPHRKRQKANRSKGGALYTVAVVVCLGVFLFSGGMLAKRFWEDRQAENEFASLQSMIDPEATPQAEETGESNSAKFAALREKNSDFIGWLSIEDTNLDFPVMFAPNNKDFYLRRDFNKEYSVYGVPYLDEKTTLGANAQSENLVIYGHNMKTGTIFGCLTGYKQAAYYAEHPYIRFDTVYRDGIYEVFAAFAIDVAADTSFVYNQYVDLDEERYNAYLDEVIARSDVDSGIRPVYGEQLLTLSTCEYSTENGRYVVVARRVED